MPFINKKVISQKSMEICYFRYLLVKGTQLFIN